MEVQASRRGLEEVIDLTKEIADCTLSPSHIKIAQLTAEGYSARRISDELGMSYSAVLGIRRSPSFHLKLKEIIDLADDKVAEIRARLVLLGHDSVDEIERILDPDGEDNYSPELKFKAANSVLDKIGVGKKEVDDRPVNVVVNQLMNQGEITIEDAVKSINGILDEQRPQKRK